MLSKLVEQLVRNQVAGFATNLIESAIDGDDKACLHEMESFYKFVCNSLVIAMKDGKRSAVEEIEVN